jgi:hypothetical protein
MGVAIAFPNNQFDLLDTDIVRTSHQKPWPKPPPSPEPTDDVMIATATADTQVIPQSVLASLGGMFEAASGVVLAIPRALISRLTGTASGVGEIAGESLTKPTKLQRREKDAWEISQSVIP